MPRARSAGSRTCGRRACRRVVAEGVRRRQPDQRAAGDPERGAGARRRAADPGRHGPALGRTGDHPFRHTGAEGAHYVPAILSGEHTWCTGYLEPNADPTSRRCARAPSARRRRLYVRERTEDLDHGRTPVELLLPALARTVDGPAKQAGLTVLLVDMKPPGIEVRPLRQITGDCEFNEVFFTDVRVPVDARLGSEDRAGRSCARRWSTSAPAWRRRSASTRTSTH